MLEPVVLAGMIFSLIVLAMLGGFILLFPITRRLGPLLEQRLRGREDPVPADDVRQLRAAVHELREELQMLNERQGFTESLLQSQSPLQSQDGDVALPADGRK